MGGPGSGNRWRFGARSTTDDLRRLDVRRLARAGVLTPGHSGTWRWSVARNTTAIVRIESLISSITVRYRTRPAGGDWHDHHYRIALTRTPVHFGGERVWFQCPGHGCGRRVAVLYLGTVFACRKCHDLAYASSRESIGDRAVRSADQIRQKLGWEPGILSGEGEKPTWMRWKTYIRLIEHHNRFRGRALIEVLRAIVPRTET